MIERVISFGKDGSLTGVLTEPEPSHAIADAPAALMWNVGIHHRVGPYRIQVDMARELARRGYASLRFDVAGMGDSEMSQDNRTDEERSLDDIREAMAVLEKRRAIRRFLPIGFCSSVDSAHALSLADDRIVGACFIEGYATRTPGFWVHYPLRVFDTMRWKRRILRKIPMLLSALGRRTAIDPTEQERGTMGPVFARNYPSRDQLGRDVHKMVSKGIRLLFIYVGGDTDFNHRGQFEEMIGVRPFGERVDVAYYDGADHTFFRVEDRRRAVVRVAEWASKAFRAGTAVGTHAAHPLSIDSTL